MGHRMRFDQLQRHELIAMLGGARSRGRSILLTGSPQSTDMPRRVRVTTDQFLCAGGTSVISRAPRWKVT